MSMPDTPVSISAITQLQNKGLNQSQVAEALGVSRQRISAIKREYGDAPMTARQAVDSMMPWKTPKHLTGTAIARWVRAHGMLLVTGGEGVSEDTLKRLAWFYRKLRDHVVVYDPDIPPNPDSKAGGFKYAAREKSDADLIMRRNEYTDINDQNIDFWRLPPEP